MKLHHTLYFVLLAGVVVRLGDSACADDAADLQKYDALIKPEDRQHWSYRPLGRHAVPKTENKQWATNPIDSFVLARLEARGWKPARAADSRAFLRRLYLDLTGLPPTLAEQEQFVSDPSPQNVRRVAWNLLARPTYGERWARHWLDVARFAETNGYERDGTKPYAWRYRDYVISSFNEDKPYDRFILEQIAGDELDDRSADTLIATGFHRLGPWDDEPADPKQDRFDQLDDIVSTTSQVFLGLTLACARCHNHKFDPLTMRDYYRMIAIFNPLQRPQWERLELDLPAGTRAEVDRVQARDREIAALRRAVAMQLAGSVATVLSAAFERNALSGPIRASAVLAAERPALMATLTAVENARKQTPDVTRGYFLQEPSPRAPATHLLVRGNAGRPGAVVAPGFPAVLVAAQPEFPPPGAQSSRRRLTLAHWIASGQNPLTARVIVNRMWQHHFGEGLVRTPNDFGKTGDAPTHPELLDWLSRWFIDHGWSLKELHHLIVTSNTYRMSKIANAEYLRDDPDNRLSWRFPYRRLDAEVIRDSMLAVTGQLNLQMYGPSIYPEVPKAALAGHSDPDKIWPAFDEKAAARRTVYAFLKRSMIVPMLEVLDLCDTTRSTGKRIVTTVAPQALTLLNGDFTNRQARHLAQRIVNEAGSDARAQVERLYRLVLCRPPTPAELSTLVQFLHDSPRTPAGSRSAEASAGGRTHHAALTEICRIVFNLNEFAYSD